MNETELKMMQSMVSILNEAKDKYYKGCPIMSDEQYDARIEDLKQFEQDSCFILLNSPTQNRDITKIDLNLLIEERKVSNPECKEAYNVNDIIENFGEEKIVAYVELNGINAFIMYKDGVIVQIETDDIESLKQTDNIPYKFDRMGFYGVYGKMVLVDNKLKFFVDEVIDDTDNGIDNRFKRAKELGFDIVPNWTADNLNPKALQGAVNYIFDYVKEDGLPYDGIIFKSNDCMHQNTIRIKEEEVINHG